MFERCSARALAALTLAAGLTITTGGAIMAQKTDWSDDKLEAYAAAIVDVSDIFSDYRPRIEGAESEEKANALRDEARTRAARAVRNEGLTVEEYTQIYQATRADAGLREKVQTLIQQERSQ